ncbi:MAG: hypothetical protein ABFD69_06610 [Candidatus Sumerlaeia bacterium]
MKTLLLVAMMAAALLTGCKTYPVYYVGEDNLATGNALKMDRAYVAPNAAELMTSRSLIVRVLDPRETIAPEISRVGKKTNMSLFQEQLEKRVADEMWRTRVFSDVSETSETWPILHPDLRLEIAITGWDKGNGFIRYILPGFISPIFRLAGTGPTRMQLEGRLVDVKTRTIVLQFTEARIHPGGPALGLSFRPFNSALLIAEDTVTTIHTLAEKVHDIAGVPGKMRKEKELRPYRSPYLNPALKGK